MTHAASETVPERDLGVDPTRLETSAPLLYFFHATGCPACARTRPHVAELARRFPRLAIESVNLAEVRWPPRTWRPPGWPAFVLILPDRSSYLLLGSRTGAQLATWLARHLPLAEFI